MTRLPKLAAGAAALAAVVVAAGCGGSSGSAGGNSYGYGSGSTSTSAMTKSTNAAGIAVTSSSLGRILVNGQGRTLYLFEKDTGKASTCYDACATAWPPVTTSGAPVARTGVVASKLGTTKRRDGTLQVTDNGHPLYMYSGDAKSGQTNGQGLDEFGAEWYALSPAGNKIENDNS